MKVLVTGGVGYIGSHLVDHLLVPSIERARKILGYEPKVRLEEELKHTIEWWTGHYPEREAS
ncbi:MAG: hypothetical protein ACE5I9_00195 [Candidatus Methylomirabilales bacterium]